MKIGVRAHDFGRMDVSGLASAIKRSGFECVQLAPAKAMEGINGIGEINDSHLASIDKAFAECGVEITVLGCYIEPSIPDKSERLANVELFKENLSHAAKLGVPIVGTETTHMDISAAPDEREKAYLLLKDSVLRMVEKAEKEGVLVGIEPVAEHTLNTPQLSRRLLDEVNSSKLKIIFDPVNLVLPGTIGEQDRIWDETFELLGDDIVVVHVKDTVVVDGAKDWSKIGEGVINYKRIMNWMREKKPEIRLLREDARMDSYVDDIKIMSSFN